MKKIILTISLLLLVNITFSDRYITRGPNPGEIYFLGPTYTGEGLYYSTNYGMTAICSDSTLDAYTINADYLSGVVYFVTLFESLYVSMEYGNQGTWQYRNSGINLLISSGLTEGNIYSAIVSHSEDFGSNFIPHMYNGFFGNLKDTEIDNQINTGYAITRITSVLDTLYLLITTDNFENLSIQNKLEMNSSDVVKISRGVNEGELFFFNKNNCQLLYSNEFGTFWTKLNNYNQSVEFDDMVGGKTEGEVYMLYRFFNLMWQNAHTYVFHSNDYGITYDVYHPFAKGQEPLVANFSAKLAEDALNAFDIKSVDSIYYVTGDMPLNVQFYNYSIGDINTYEWDFDNNGIIDSYEENPMYTYSDTGWFSVSLTVYDDYDTNSFLRENYVYVYELTDIEKQDESSFGIACYPNPFKDKIIFTFLNNGLMNENELLIYDINGRIVNQFKTKDKEFSWDGTNSIGSKCKPGIYIITNKNQEITKKIVLNN
ncbi:MAG: T9SS type A sorting domain-containing protein [Bacteroidales bacterium]